MRGKHRALPSFFIPNIMVLRKTRISKGLTQQDLAVKSGIKTHVIQCYERYEYYPKKENYNKLAEIFGWQKWE